MVRSGEFSPVISSAFSDELRDAPEPVRAFFHDLGLYVEVAEIDFAALELQAAYLDAHVVGPQFGNL